MQNSNTCDYGQEDLHKGQVFAEDWHEPLRRKASQLNTTICPICGCKMDALLSGARCPDVQHCGYHTHNGPGL